MMGVSVFICVGVFIVIAGQSLAANWSGNIEDRCFCQLKGKVGDCSCKVETLDLFNNNKVYPRLQSLLSRNYFRYFTVNLKKGCPFWPEDSKCTVRDCHVDVCSQDDVPIKIKSEESNLDANKHKYSRESNELYENADEENCAMEKNLSALDTTISDEKRTEFEIWKQHDVTYPVFCDVDEEDSDKLEYVDLLLNPERYTGYKGNSAHRIWKSIYEENCFKPENNHNEQDSTRSYGTDAFLEPAMCLEKRVFHSLISGLHTSINVHLSDKYLFSAKAGFGASIWDHNLKEFLSRFDPAQTNGQGPQRLKNLYFTYLIELRALAKVIPYLNQEEFYTGDQTEDADLKKGVVSLLTVIKSFPDHFNERELFNTNTNENRQLKAEFVQHFRNITRIMDCVECDKCRLWGKLQVLGMGTSLKILFSGDSINNKNFQLTRSEIVALFNGFGRLSSSIYAVETFRKLAGKPNQSV